MRAYEIHTYQNGRWKIDAVFDDRSLALFEAKRMDEGNRFSGVRVVEESYDESSEQSMTRTIFRGGHAESQIAKENNKANARNEARTRSARGSSRERGPRPGAARRTRKKKSGFTGPLIVLALLIVAGLAGLFGLQQLFTLG